MSSEYRSGKVYYKERSGIDQIEIDYVGFCNGATGIYEVMPSGLTPLPAVRCFVSVTEMGGKNGLTQVLQKDVPIQRPIGMPYQGDGLLESVLFPKMTITRTDNCICIPGGVILRGDTVLEDSFNATWMTSQHKSLIPQDSYWKLKTPMVDIGACSEIDDDVLYMDSEHIDWFGHVIGDLLSRAWGYSYIKLYLDAKNLKILCSDTNKEFVKLLLLSIGVDLNDILFIKQPTLCRRLLLATKAFQIQEYVAPPAFSLWQGMRNRLSGIDAVPSKIYVSRRANPTRRLLEEEEIENFFVQQGFFVLYPEAISIYKQMHAFKGASYIAGCSGSNLFNLAFAGSVQAVFVMASPLLVHYSEQMFCAQRKGISIDLVVGFVDDEDLALRPGYVHCNWHLDVSAVRQCITQWLERG